MTEMGAQDGPDSGTSGVGAAVRVAVTAHRSARWSARRSARRVARAERAYEEQMAYEKAIEDKLNDPVMLQRGTEITKAMNGRISLGYVGAWMTAGVARSLLVVCVLVDGTFTYTTVRKKLDVPASVAPYDVTDPDNLLAVGVAAALVLILVSVINFGPSTIAWSLHKDRSQYQVGTS